MSYLFAPSAISSGLSPTPPSFPVLQIDLSDLAAEAHSKYRYVLVIIDHFSKHVWLRALKTKHAAEIASHVSVAMDQHCIQHVEP